MIIAKLTRKEIKWIKNNFNHLTNMELLEQINAQRKECAHLRLTTFRTLLYKKGIKRNTVLRWTDKETKYLLENYQTVGNIELAENLKKIGRTFRKKNIEKKMILLGLKRTPEQLQFIREAHKKKGAYRSGNAKMWKTRGRVPEGGTKIQIINGRPQVSIKVEGKLIAYARYRYKQLHGEIPKGFKVYFADCNFQNTEDSNLISRKARRLNNEEVKAYAKHYKAYFDSLQKEHSEPKPEALKPSLEPSSKKIGVRINRKTIIYVPPGTNIAELRERYNRPISSRIR